MTGPNDELRAARGRAGLSRAELAEAVAAHVWHHRGRRVGIDAHYVARLERGAVRWPGADYRAALRDVLALGTDAALGLGPPSSDPAGRVLDAAPDPDVWDRLAGVLDAPHRVDPTAVDHLSRMLADQRRLEDVVGARSVLPATLAQLDLVDSLARSARDSVRADVLAVGSQWRQFAAWQSEDIGRPADALAHYDRAMEAAQEIGDDNMVTSVLSLKSHLAWSQRDSARAVGLAVAGQHNTDRVTPGVLALVVQQEARGRALDGDATRVDRLLDRSADLTDRAHADPDSEPPWVYFQAPERALYQRGIAYLELGRHDDAADLFDAARALLPASYRRDDGRYAASLALASAHAGDVERATVAAHHALTVGVETGSGGTLSAIRRARHILDRWATHPAVRALDDAARAAAS